MADAGLLGHEIALLAFGAFAGIGAACYALGQVGKSRSIPVNIAWIGLFGLGATAGASFGLLAAMGSV